VNTLFATGITTIALLHTPLSGSFIATIYYIQSRVSSQDLLNAK